MNREEPRPAAPAGDDTAPSSIARVYDFLLDGKDNFAVDRAEAARLLAVSPHLPRLARENRDFLTRAVQYLARQGIAQFIDLGSGLPAATNTHQAAQAVLPGARVVYVDSDPVVVAHAIALLTGDGTTTAIRADLTDPGGVLEQPGLRQLIDLSEPVAVVAAMVLHFVSADEARRITGELVAGIVPGSYLVISAGSGIPEVGDQLAASYRAGHLYNHSPAEIASFLGRTEIIGPGLVFAADWAPGKTVSPPVLTEAHVLAGIGQVSR